MHPVPMDGTDGKVANEPSRVRVSVVEPSGTWTFGLGKNRDMDRRVSSASSSGLSCVGNSANPDHL